MMLEAITDPLIRSQIEDAFLQYHQGRIEKDYCLANIQMIIDFGFKLNKLKDETINGQAIFDELKKRESIKIVDVISKKERQEKWLDNFDATASEIEDKNSIFKQYQQILRKEGKNQLAFKLKKEVYQILDSTPRPEEGIGWRCKGLVFGKVQSGKTSNFIGVISKALDVGYDFIIVLAGISEDLRQQTQDRIDKYIFRHELNGIKYYNIEEDSEASVNANLINLTVSSRFSNEKRKSGDFKIGEINRGAAKRGPEILIIKKNSSILKDVLRYLDSLCDEESKSGKKINSKTCLIIDDECDNASVLSQTKTEFENKEETRAINKSIRRIINLFKRVSYIGYTATPENVVMQPITSPANKETVHYRDTEITYHIEKDLTLFPDDFIQIVNPSEGYLGLNEWLDSQNNHIKIIPNEDLVERKEYSYFLSNSLISSFLDFVANVYIRKFLWRENDNNSMLVHPSVLKSDQEQLKEILSDFRKKIVKDSLRGETKSSFFKLIKNRIKRFEPLENIEFEKYSQIINNLDIVTVHSGESATILNFKIVKDRIIIGGNKLSRGFTIEGLTVSYFFRKSSRLDTLHQMARWFGYRGKSTRLITVYLPKEDKEYFEFMASFDKDLTEQIDSMNFQEMDPENFGITLLFDQDYLGYNKMTKRRMSLTDPNKMRNFEIRGRFTKPIIIRHLQNDVEINNENYQRAFNWFSNLVETENPFSLKFSTNEKDLYYKKTKSISDGGKIYFTGVPLNKILDLYDNLEFGESKTALNLIESIRETMDVDFSKWSVMISRKKESKDYTKEFYNERTFILQENEVYVSSVEDPQNLEEDIFDLIQDEEEFKEFIKNTTTKRTVALNKKRKSLRKPLLKLYFARPSDKSSDGVRIEKSVLIGFKVPTKSSVYERKK